MPLRLPAVEQLVAFRAVARYGNFSRAAGDLSLTQSAVSHQVRKLEATIGHALLSRSAHGVALTEIGKQLLEDISGPLEALDQAVARCKAGGGPKRLGLELDSGFAATWLAPRLPHFQARHPDIHLEHFYSLRLEFPSHVDVAIKFGDGRWPGLLSESLMGLHYTPLCAPSLLRDNQLCLPGDVRRFGLIHDRDRRDWADWLRIADIPAMDLKAGHIVNDTNVLMRLLAAGEGIGLCAVELSQHYLTSGELIAPFPDIILPSREQYHILRKKNSQHDDAIDKFSSWIRDEVRDFLAVRPLSSACLRMNDLRCISPHGQISK